MREELDLIHAFHMEEMSKHGNNHEHYYHYNNYTIFVDKWGFIEDIISTDELGF